MEYTEVDEQIRTAGRGFGIFHEMWRPFATILEKGLEGSTTNISALPEVYELPIFFDRLLTYNVMNSDKPYVNSFRNLLMFSPIVKAQLADSPSDKGKIRSLLDAARDSTRRSHASAVKTSIGDWHEFSPGLSRKPSSPIGWEHDECARLLCPPTIEWNDE